MNGGKKGRGLGRGDGDPKLVKVVKGKLLLRGVEPLPPSSFLYDTAVNTFIFSHLPVSMKQEQVCGRRVSGHRGPPRAIQIWGRAEVEMIGSVS